MACGESCRRLSAGAGITITPDCCGGCVISATGGTPQVPSGCTCTLVENANHPGILVSPGPAPGSYVLGLDPSLVESPAAAQQKADAVRQEAQQCCGRVAGDVQTLTDRLNSFPPVPTAFLTPEQAAQIADDAAKKSVGEHAAKTNDVHGIPSTSDLETKDGAQKKAEDAAKAAVDQYAKDHPGTEGLTEEQVNQIVSDALRQHASTCHTLNVVTEGVTAEEGWKVTKQELREIGGTRTAVIWLQRTGENIASKTIDQQAGDGLPEEGNIVPDLLIAKVAGDWIPPVTQLHGAHTGYTDASVRINTAGEIYLATLTSNNELRTNQYLVFEYEFQVRSGCESGEGGGTPAPGGVTREEAQQIAQQAVADTLAQYPSEFADNFDNIDVTTDQWVSLDPPVSITLKIPPSRKVQVTTCFTARNTQTQIQTYQAVEVAMAGTVLIAPADSRAVTLSSDSPGDPTSACHMMIVNFATLNGGSAKAGDEVTFTAKNRKANTPNDPGSGVSTVLDRNLSVVSLIGAVPAS